MIKLCSMQREEILNCHCLLNHERHFEADLGHIAFILNFIHFFYVLTHTNKLRYNLIY